MNQTAVIIGAGSGVGQSTAIKLAKKGWRVAVVGRHLETLQETVGLAAAESPSSPIQPYVCDIGDLDAVTRMGRKVLEDLGSIDVLVNAAGINSQKRSLAVLSPDDYHQMINTNLNGAYYCVQAFLPRMRTQRSGTIINIVSDAGKQASALAGPAYVMSKFGMAGLTQSINAEERLHGVRASSIFPGEIDTPLLRYRPQVPDASSRARMLQANDVADCALFCIELPPHVIIEEMIVRPR